MSTPLWERFQRNCSVAEERVMKNKIVKPGMLPVRRRSVTIRDVAQRAGVSTATVSRALAAPDRVAEATRVAVFSAIDAIGFTPNASARSLRARSTKMVLALLHGIGNSFYTVILNAIEEALFKAGYGMIMGDTRADPARERHYERLVLSGQVDGVLLLSGRMPPADFGNLDRIVPIILICNDIPELPSIPVVESANRDAARQMVDYLIGLGHRRIAHVTGPIENVEAQERIRGFQEGIAAAGLVAAECPVWEGRFSTDAGVAAATRFLAASGNGPERPSAIFSANDEVALGLIKTLRDAGLSVPQDVSVAGFDDIEYANLIEPALTTMHQPRVEIGRLAAEALVQRMQGIPGAPQPRTTRLPCTLVIRDSVAPWRPSLSGKPAPAGKTARIALA
jgi:LacI family repressor for deo operon, udp, cdd, tsx, nupC, and nupG